METSASSGRTMRLFHSKSMVTIEHVLNVANSYLAYRLGVTSAEAELTSGRTEYTRRMNRPIRPNRRDGLYARVVLFRQIWTDPHSLKRWKKFYINTNSLYFSPCYREQSRQHTSLCVWQKRRFIVALLAFFGFFNVYALRVNLSVAVVAMTEPVETKLENGTIVMVSTLQANKDAGNWDI
jgi:hypothetical protein